MPSKLNTTQQLIFLVLLFLAVALPRLYYVNSFAVALPFWDQWDAEGDFLLRLWVENKLKFSDLLSFHNEHRIFPTRLLSLLLFEITDEWNNLTEARFNILLASAIPILLISVLLKDGALREMRWFILSVLLAQFALPFPFENLLVGFQSQFYFLILFTLTSLILVTYRQESGYAAAAVLVLCILSVTTMGSGFLTAVAVAGVCVLNWYTRSTLSIRNLLLILALIVIAVVGYFLVPQIPNHQVFRPQNISQFINALGYILSWPTADHQPAFLLWTPAVVMIPMLLFRKNMTRADLLMAGCFIWSFLQAGAIAYGRGQELTVVASRYTELFSLGLIANAWFSVRFMERYSSYRLRWLAVAFFLTFFYGHWTRFNPEFHYMKLNHEESLIQTHNVCMYLKTGDKSFLQKTGREIPFPNPERLQMLLDNRTIRGMLPEPMRGCAGK